MQNNYAAEKLGVPVNAYADCEQARRQPCIDDIYKLLIILNVDANELFDKSGL